LPVEVKWLDGEKGVIKTAELPSLASAYFLRSARELKLVNVFRPAVFPLSGPSAGVKLVDWEAMLICLGAALLVYVPSVWWLGRRYGFTIGARLGWSLFVLAAGFPGLIAFLSVHEWPIRETCPNCGKLRVVNRQECQYCGGASPAPQRSGTEIFAPAATS
jgi:hypothetical protein